MRDEVEGLHGRQVVMICHFLLVLMKRDALRNHRVLVQSKGVASLAYASMVVVPSKAALKTLRKPPDWRYAERGGTAVIDRCPLRCGCLLPSQSLATQRCQFFSFSLEHRSCWCRSHPTGPDDLIGHGS